MRFRLSCFFRITLLLCLRVSSAYAETPALDAELAELQTLETQLTAQYRDLPKGGLPGWEARVALLSPEQRAKIAAAATRRTDLSGEPGDLGALIRDVKAHELATARFQADYDLFNDRKLDYLLDRYQHFAATAIDHARAQGLPPARLAQLEKFQTDLNTEYASYHENRNKRGTALDRVRGHHLMRYMRTLQTLGTQAGRPFRTTAESILLTLDPIARGYEKVEQAASFLPSLPGAYGALNRGNGIMRALRDGVRRNLAAWGIRHSVEGRENIQRVAEPGVVNVYVPMHPNGLLDVATLAELNIPRAAVVSAVAPPIFTEQFKASKDFVVVKHDGGNPVKLIKEKLAGGKLDGLIIFPQGGAVGAAYEERQVQRSFPLLLSLMRKEGMRLRVIPISQPYSHRLMTMMGPGESPLDKRQMLTRVHEPISPAVVDLMLASGDRSITATLLRQGWIDSVAGSFEPGRRVVGMPSIATLRAALDRQLLKRTRCHYWRDLLTRWQKEREPRFGAPSSKLLAA